MIDKLPPMTLKSIGIVRNDIKETTARRNRDEVESEVVLDNSLTEGLDGLEGYSHVIVLFWMHRAMSDEVPLKVHPMGRKELPLTGIFAVCTPNRPNRIGKTVVRLLRRQGNILKVKGLDAIDGSPVIDIKPYIPHSDSVPDAKVPQWITNH